MLLAVLFSYNYRLGRWVLGEWLLIAVTNSNFPLLFVIVGFGTPEVILLVSIILITVELGGQV